MVIATLCRACFYDLKLFISCHLRIFFISVFIIISLDIDANQYENDNVFPKPKLIFFNEFDLMCKGGSITHIRMLENYKKLLSIMIIIRFILSVYRVLNHSSSPSLSPSSPLIRNYFISLCSKRAI